MKGSFYNEKIISMLLIVVMLLLQSYSMVSAAGDSSITVHNTDTKGLYLTINGNSIEFKDAKPFIDSNGRTQVPIRCISENLNSSVDWNSVNRTVTVKHGNDVITLMIDSNIMDKNGVSIEMDTNAIIKDDFTYIPIRYVAEGLNCQIIYTDSDEEFKGENNSGNVEGGFYDGMLEDEAQGLNGNIVDLSNIYNGDDTPQRYLDLLNQTIATSSEMIGHTVDEIHKSEDEEAPLSNLRKTPLDLSKGQIGFTIQNDSDGMYEYESIPISNHGKSILVAYYPKTVTDKESVDGIPVYINAYNSELRTYSFMVGSVYCKYGNITVAKITGLRDDRDYTLKLFSHNINKSDNAVIKVVSLDE